MSNGPLPLLLEPLKLADRGACFSGELPLSRFTRLAALVTDTAGQVQVALSFYLDEHKQALLQLKLETSLALQCQRCLEEVRYPIDESFHYLISTSAEEPDFLPDGYDLLQVGDEPLELLTMVEDELLLCLPIVAMHPEGECDFPGGYAVQQQDAEQATESNPFSVLAQLKRDKNP